MTTEFMYEPNGAERQAFEVAYRSGTPLMLTGPTGCGKTRLVEHMAHRLERELVTITCHDDLTAHDLVGRFLVQDGDVRWADGPLTRAVRQGAICYLDEVIEARKDTLAVLHSLADHRRTLYLDRTDEAVAAPDGFMLVCSYNPRARGALKELKASFRQRFATVQLDYLPPEAEARIVVSESGITTDVAGRLVQQARAIRAGSDASVGESPSTRALVLCARLIQQGLDERQALEIGLIGPMAASGTVEAALAELVAASGSGTDN